MKKHYRKIIAPVVVILFIITYFIFLGIQFFIVDMPPIEKFLAVVIPVAFISVSIFVLVERIKEIRSGEEDDLSKY